VFEHLQDPIHFLQRCERALKESGKLILLVPDRSFCFDYFRPVSTAGQMLRAFLDGRKQHDPGTLYDHHALTATRNGAIAWVETDNTAEFAGTPAAGYSVATRTANEYIDCHAWVFTPSSFRLILSDLRSLGLLTLGEAFFHPSIGCEFMVVLSRSGAVELPPRVELARRMLLESAQFMSVPAAPAVRDNYIVPFAQNAVDVFRDVWVSKFPEELGLSAGDVSLHDDDRIKWLVATAGGVQGLDILELGPLEAGHTAMLLAAGARSVLAIEGNPQAFLRCLVVKEVRKLRDASFLLGDFTTFLQRDERHWPMIVASGVLYHMEGPLRLLELVAARTDTLFLWTHVVDTTVMPAGDPRWAPIARQETLDWRGETMTLHVRPYGEVTDPKFCGGLVSEPRWMEREDVLKALRILGFEHITISHENPTHPAGPSLAILAQRRR
jgi:hypothetical protein